MNRYTVTVAQPIGAPKRFQVVAGNITDAKRAARRRLAAMRVDHRGYSVTLVRPHPGRKRRR